MTRGCKAKPFMVHSGRTLGCKSFLRNKNLKTTKTVPNMENTKQQLVDRIKSASNVLVTVGRNPSVDALSALLGLTLILNKQGKHAAAVFSGEVPSTIEFLQPEETIEKNTDSLRDFIIALDKNKADKLRYKVEDNVVRIFITPYKTSISQEDFEFSEGDFNIDVVIALGVRQQEDLDEAITAHGRILHDATVTTINIVTDAGLGSINWSEPQASSLSELVTELAQVLGANLFDEQIATALLTGIVAETDRFSNDKTSSVTMSMSATLMKAGANQQLVASKLEGQLSVRAPDPSDKSNASDSNSQASDGTAPKDDGAIRIDHNDSSDDTSLATPTSEHSESDQAPSPDGEEQTPEIKVDEAGSPTTPAIGATTNLSSGAKLITEPPTLGGTLTANSAQSELDPVTDPFSMPQSDDNQLIEHDKPADIKAHDLAPPSSLPPAPAVSSPPQVPVTPSLTPPPPNWTPPASPPTPPPTQPSSKPPSLPLPPDGTGNGDDETLADIEHAVASPHATSPTIDAARDEVKRAYNDTSGTDSDALPAIDSLNAQPLGDELHPGNPSPKTDLPQTSQPTDSTAPPPVPPPIPFQFGNSSQPPK